MISTLEIYSLFEHKLVGDMNENNKKDYLG